MEGMEQPDEKELMSNPYVLSDTLSMGPLSFIDTKVPFNKLCPVPKYFTTDFLKEKFALPQNKSDILFGYEMPANGGLVCTN